MDTGDKNNAVMSTSDRLGYSSVFGMLVALTVCAIAVGVVWNSGWSIISFIMPAVACLGPAGIILMHFLHSTNVGFVMAIIMICIFPISSMIVFGA